MRLIEYGATNTTLLIDMIAKLGRCATRLLVLLSLLWVLGCASKKVEPVTDAELAEQEIAAQKQRFSDGLEALQDGDLSSARAQFQALHAQYPDLTGPLANLGYIALQEENRSAAIGYFDQVLALDANHLAALNYRGVLAREQGEFDVAEDYYRKALAVDPEYLPALRNLAILLDLYQGRLQEALALYEQYQSLLPEPDRRVKDWIFDIKNRIGES